uniref:Uncharacterized protein n=1 Tax=Rhizophora mucronata TaxID=61149 RepID=A0A2P2NIH2_RHIMU
MQLYLLRPLERVLTMKEIL